MKILGIILIVFGVIDILGSFMNFDLWGDVIGITLPELIWTWSGYIEVGVGYWILRLGKGAGTEEGTDSVEG